MSNATQFLGGGVKSVQRGQATATNGTTSVTISAVDPAKSVVILSTLIKGGEPNGSVRYVISNSTTLSVTGDSGIVGFVSTWQIVEYY